MARKNGASLSELECLSDLVLVSSDGVKLPVHKVLLAKYSGFFLVMFSSGSSLANLETQMGPNSRQEVNFQDVAGGTLNTLVDLIYSNPGKVFLCTTVVIILVSCGFQSSFCGRRASSTEARS